MAGIPAVTAAQDRPHGRLADAVAQTSQFAVHPAGPPGRVLPREPQHQIPDIPAGRRASWPAGMGPCTRGEAAVPGQQRPWRDEPVTPERCWQQPAQRRHDRPAGPARPRPGDLAPQHRHLMPQHPDLRVPGRRPAAQQREPALHADHDQVEQAKRHEPRSWRIRLHGQAAGQSQSMRQFWSSTGCLALMPLRLGSAACGCELPRQRCRSDQPPLPPGRPSSPARVRSSRSIIATRSGCLLSRRRKSGGNPS